jgi:thioredoxin-like negative regulator of GroEL
MRLLLFSVLFLILTGCQTVDSTANVAAKAEIKFEVLSTGKVIDLEPHVTKQGYTVFDFYADWCAPCTKLNKSLKDMKQVYGDQLHVFKLDIVDWESELAKEFKIRELPHLVVYNPDGTLFAQGPSKNVLPALVSALNRGPES